MVHETENRQLQATSQSSDWDTSWMILRAHGFDKLGDAGLARQHDGWQAVEELDESSANDDKAFHQAEYFPYPTLSLPSPKLDFDFRIAVQLNKQPSHVEIPGSGAKDLTTITSGRWSGSFGRGLVTAGGHDLQLSESAEQFRSRIDTAFSLETTDDPPAVLEMRTRGYISSPSQTLASLIDESKSGVDPRSYAFRMVVTLQTQDMRYAGDLNMALWIGSGMWKGSELILDAYRIA